MDLVVNIYGATDSFLKAETYGLTSQIRRAVTSIPATRLGFLSALKHAELQVQLDEVGRLLNGLMRSVANSPTSNI